MAIQRKGPTGDPGAKRRLTREDWTRAALTALAEGGLAAVAVEPLATRIGTTKGSFYWHFANRDALIEASLAYWEEHSTEQVIRLLDSERDPRTRLEKLFVTVMERHPARDVELALLAAADHPLVGPALRRLTERRIDYVAGIFVDLGAAASVARDRAVFAFTSYLGTLHLARVHHRALPDSPAAWQTYRSRNLDLLLADLPDDRETRRPPSGERLEPDG